MSIINPINFRGNETVGSPAYLTNSLKETVGSPAYLTSALKETVGSPAYLTNNPEAPVNPNFKGYDSFERQEKPDKKTSMATIGISSLVAAALIIGGLGYAHKVDVLSKMKDGKMKEMLTKIEPIAKVCHEWCSITKTKGNECLEAIKKFFKSKGN